nr:putative disease resistance protein [Quercus suber]
MQVHIRRDLLELKRICFEKKAVGAGVLCSVPPPPKFIVGLDEPLKELKTMLLKEGKEESLLLVTAPGGCGKTTLVIKLSQDKDIEGLMVTRSVVELWLIFKKHTVMTINLNIEEGRTVPKVLTLKKP